MPKPYSIRFTGTGHYLVAEVSGTENSFDTAMQYWKEILAEIKSSGHKKLMVTENFAVDVSKTDMYFIAAWLSKMDFRGIWIAFLDETNDRLELNQFSELVTGNRGLITKAFTNRGEAEKWLLP
jgi:hypothetical protein